MWRVTIKGLLAHKLRLALTALAIVLGVTFISGTFILTDTLHNTFTTLFGNIYQNIDFQVRGVAQFSAAAATRRATPSPSRSCRRCKAVPGVEAADGLGHRLRRSTSPPTARRSPPAARRRIGLSFDPDPTALRAPPDARGPRRRRPTTWSWMPAPRRSTTSRSASRSGCCCRTHRETFTITGIARFGTANNLAGATLAAFDLPTAQALFGEAGSSTPSMWSTAARRGQGNGAARASRESLPPGVRGRDGADRRERGRRARSSQALAFFNTALLVFAFIALFVGGFTILNTFSIIVGQRTRELALLRIVGASRRQVFRSVLARRRSSGSRPR